MRGISRLMRRVLSSPRTPTHPLRRKPGGESLQSVIMVTRVAASFMKATVFFFPAVVGLAQWFHLREYRHLVWPMGLLVTALALLPENYSQLLRENSIWSLYFVLPIALSIPVMWVIALIRGVGEPLENVED